MASGMIASAILAMMKGNLDLDTVDARVVGVSSAYTFSSAHDNLDDLTNIITDAVAVTGELVSAITGGGKFDFDDPTLTNVNGALARVFCYDHNGGSDAARRLLAVYDAVTGTLSGGSVPLTVNASGAATITSSPS